MSVEIEMLFGRVVQLALMQLNDGKEVATATSLKCLVFVFLLQF